VSLGITSVRCPQSPLAKATGSVSETSLTLLPFAAQAQVRDWELSPGCPAHRTHPELAVTVTVVKFWSPWTPG
jgi:hypothetical protein